MKLGIYGLMSSGRKTVFDAVCAGLRESDDSAKQRKMGRLEMVRVPDPRLDVLTGMYNPAKTTAARITYCLPDDTTGQTQMLSDMSGCEGLIFVIRNFTDLAGEPANPIADLSELEDELILRDLGVAEGRMERLAKGKSKGVTALPGEEEAIKEVVNLLNEGIPIRTNPDLASHAALRQYAFLTAKPRLIVSNNEEGDDSPADLDVGTDTMLVLQAKLEMELAGMNEEEAEEFRQEYGLTEPGLNRMVNASLQMLDVISFFTVGEDEVRAWTIPRNAPATKAAGAIHSDLEKGFIRAEVVAYDDLIACGSEAEAKKKGLHRLEGKGYPVKDGDIINVRFNV